MQKAGTQAKTYFQSGYKCAESALMAIAENQGIKNDLIPALATGFCSGMARTGGICGAVAGSVMGLSLVYGRKNSSDAVEPLYTIEKIFLQEFTDRFGSTSCEGLIHCDFNTPEGQSRYNENKLYNDCFQYVEEAVDLAVKLIEEHPAIN